jgi:hypothetical protein
MIKDPATAIRNRSRLYFTVVPPSVLPLPRVCGGGNFLFGGGLYTVLRRTVVYDLCHLLERLTAEISV